VVVEGGGEVAGEFEVLDLVFTNRDVRCAVRVEYVVSSSVTSHGGVDLQPTYAPEYPLPATLGRKTIPISTLAQTSPLSPPRQIYSYPTSPQSQSHTSAPHQSTPTTPTL